MTQEKSEQENGTAALENTAAPAGQVTWGDVALGGSVVSLAASSIPLAMGVRRRLDQSRVTNERAPTIEPLDVARSSVPARSAVTDPGFEGGRYSGLNQDNHFLRDIRAVNSEEAVRLLTRGSGNASSAITSEGAGTTATAFALTDDMNLVIHQLGDSPIGVVVTDEYTRQRRWVDLTRDHSVTAEADRIRRAGGNVFRQRGTDYVGTPNEGGVNVARSFGDRSIQGVSSVADIHIVDLNTLRENPGDRLDIVVMSDGINEVERVDRLLERIEGQPLNALTLNTAAHAAAAEDLANRRARDLDSMPDYDNRTVLVAEAQPGHAVSGGIYDGHGRGGETLSRQAASIFENVLDTRGYPAIQLQPSQPSRPPISPSRPAPAAANDDYIRPGETRRARFDRIISQDPRAAYAAMPASAARPTASNDDDERRRRATLDEELRSIISQDPRAASAAPRGASSLDETLLDAQRNIVRWQSWDQVRASDGQVYVQAYTDIDNRLSMTQRLAPALDTLNVPYRLAETSLGARDGTTRPVIRIAVEDFQRLQQTVPGIEITNERLTPQGRPTYRAPDSSPVVQGRDEHPQQQRQQQQQQQQRDGVSVVQEPRIVHHSEIDFDGAEATLQIRNYHFFNATEGEDRIDFAHPDARTRLNDLAGMLEGIESRTGGRFDPYITIGGRYDYMMTPGVELGDPGRLQLGTYGWAEGNMAAAEAFSLHEMGHQFTRNANFLHVLQIQANAPLALDTFEHFVRNDPVRAQGWMGETFGSVGNAQEYIDRLRPTADSVIQALETIQGRSDIDLAHRLTAEPHLLRGLADATNTDEIFRLISDEERPFTQILLDAQMQDPVMRARNFQALNAMEVPEAVRDKFQTMTSREFPVLPQSSEFEALARSLSAYHSASTPLANTLSAVQRADEYLADRFALHYSSDPAAYLDTLSLLEEVETSRRQIFSVMQDHTGVDVNTHPSIPDRIREGRAYLVDLGRGGNALRAAHNELRIELVSQGLPQQKPQQGEHSQQQQQQQQQQRDGMSAEATRAPATQESPEPYRISRGNGPRARGIQALRENRVPQPDELAGLFYPEPEILRDNVGNPLTERPRVHGSRLFSPQDPHLPRFEEALRLHFPENAVSSQTMRNGSQQFYLSTDQMRALRERPAQRATAPAPARTAEDYLIMPHNDVVEPRRIPDDFHPAQEHQPVPAQARQIMAQQQAQQQDGNSGSQTGQDPSRSRNSSSDSGRLSPRPTDGHTIVAESEIGTEGYMARMRAGESMWSLGETLGNTPASRLRIDVTYPGYGSELQGLIRGTDMNANQIPELFGYLARRDMGTFEFNRENGLTGNYTIRGTRDRMQPLLREAAELGIEVNLDAATHQYLPQLGSELQGERVAGVQAREQGARPLDMAARWSVDGDRISLRTTRYNLPFAADPDMLTREMRDFSGSLHDQGIRVHWQWNDNAQAFAHVLESDRASTEALRRIRLDGVFTGEGYWDGGREGNFLTAQFENNFFTRSVNAVERDSFAEHMRARGVEIHWQHGVGRSKAHVVLSDGPSVAALERDNFRTPRASQELPPREVQQVVVDDREPQIQQQQERGPETVPSEDAAPSRISADREASRAARQAEQFRTQQALQNEYRRRGWNPTDGTWEPEYHAGEEALTAARATAANPDLSIPSAPEDVSLATQGSHETPRVGGMAGVVAFAVAAPIVVSTFHAVTNPHDDENYLQAAGRGASEGVEHLVLDSTGLRDFDRGDNLRAVANIAETTTGGMLPVVQILDNHRLNVAIDAVPADRADALRQVLRPNAQPHTGNARLDTIQRLLAWQAQGQQQVIVDMSSGNPEVIDPAQESLIGQVWAAGSSPYGRVPVPLAPVLEREIRAYLAQGGSVEAAHAILDPAWAHSRAAQNIAELAPGAGTNFSPPGNDHLQQIANLKLHDRNGSNTQQILEQAQQYVAHGGTPESARFAYYRASLVIEPTLLRDIASHGLTQEFDLNHDGHVTISEVGAVLRQNRVGDLNHSGRIGIDDVVAQMPPRDRDGNSRS